MSNKQTPIQQMVNLRREGHSLKEIAFLMNYSVGYVSQLTSPGNLSKGCNYKQEKIMVPKDIADHLAAKTNKSAYIRRLIRKDMEAK